MENSAALDVVSLEADGVSLDDFLFYHCRVRAPKIPGLFADRIWITASLMTSHQCI